MTDIVAVWNVSLPDGRHKVEFEHGTTSGKRAIYVDGQEVYKVDWMFKLVGKEHFTIGKHKQFKCTIIIDACSGFAYEYTLEVNGKSLEKFRENQGKIMHCWCFTDASDSSKYRVVLERDTLDVWVNGKVVETMGEFTDDGTETHFVVGGTHSAYIKNTSSQDKRKGIIHQLFVDDSEIPEAKE